MDIIPSAFRRRVLGKGPHDGVQFSLTRHNTWLPHAQPKCLMTVLLAFVRQSSLFLDDVWAEEDVTCLMGRQRHLLDPASAGQCRARYSSVYSF